MPATQSSTVRRTVRPGLTLRRRLNAAPAKVYAAWLEPEKIAGWFGPSQVITGSVQADVEPRTGGRYRIGFRTEDGQRHEVGGIYREMVPNQRLVFSWAWHTTPERESLVTITLKPDGEGTLLTLDHEQFFDQAARDAHEGGWHGTLDKLEQFFS